MPQPLTYPGVYIEEVPSGVRTIAGVATSIGLFIGWAARGTKDEAVRIFSFADFEREYGGLDQRSFLGYAVRHFFDNGGTDAYVIRVVTISDGGNGATSGVVSSANGTFTFTASSEGQWSDNYGVRYSPTPQPGDANRFKLEVLFIDKDNNQTVVEAFENLSLADTDLRFVKAMVNKRSSFITVEVNGAALSNTTDTVKFKDGTPGKDGDVIQPGSAEMKAAVDALFTDDGIATKLDLFNLVCVPGDTTIDNIQAYQRYCAKKRAFLVVDAPTNVELSAMGDQPAKYATGDAGSYAAMYFPWVDASDPLLSGALREFPPCGFVAGVMARTDAARGVWKAPAGTESTLNGALEFEVVLSDPRIGVLNPKAVNCLRTLPVYGNVVWGARTLFGDNDRASEWKYVPVRRMALFLEESLFRGTQWVVFEPNDEPLWAEIRLNIGAFMQVLFRQGAFQGATPREAYFVKCDRTTTTQTDINMGVVNILVGFAPLKPAEFVVLRIQQIAGEIAT